MKIGIFGTFDVENYGDILFPIIAENELKNRIGEIDLIIFSYNTKSNSEWPYNVLSLDLLDRYMPDMDAVIIGGGHIIRFDKNVAPNYLPVNSSIAHPCGYWLSPALAALSKNVKVIWNAPSASYEMPAWGQVLLSYALDNSEYVSVRDIDTCRNIKQSGYDGICNIVPDTAFNLSKLFPIGSNNKVKCVLESMKIKGKYIIVQPYIGINKSLEKILPWLIDNGIEIVSLPIGPILGDSDRNITTYSDKIKSIGYWPDPLLLAAIVSESSGVIAHSLHLSITAISYNIPVLRQADHSLGKYRLLRSSENVYWYSDDEYCGIESFMKIVLFGNNQEERFVRDMRTILSRHWDTIADICCTKNNDTDNSYRLANSLITRMEKLY